MKKIYFYTSQSNNWKEMIKTVWKSFYSCELKAMQVNFNLYGTFKLPWGYDTTRTNETWKNIIQAKNINYIKKEIRDFYNKKNAFIDAIIESEKWNFILL